MKLITKLTSAIMMMMLIIFACGKDDPPDHHPPTDDLPAAIEEMFPFLKIGNEWEYSAYTSPIWKFKISIDSIEVINENESKYFGSIYDWNYYQYTIRDVNLLLFHLKDSVLIVNIGYFNCSFDYNWMEGQIVDSLDYRDSTGTQQ